MIGPRSLTTCSVGAEAINPVTSVTVRYKWLDANQMTGDEETSHLRPDQLGSKLSGRTTERAAHALQYRFAQQLAEPGHVSRAPERRSKQCRDALPLRWKHVFEVEAHHPFAPSRRSVAHHLLELAGDDGQVDHRCEKRVFRAEEIAHQGDVHSRPNGYRSQRRAAKAALGKERACGAQDGLL